MKTKGTKRFISFLLVFVMMVSSLTLNLQAEEITYINLPDAVNTEPVDTDISNIEEEPPDSDEEIPPSELVEENQGELLDKDDSDEETSSDETAKDDRPSEEETENGEINQATYELSVLLDETLGTVEIEFLENNIDGSSKWQVYSNITFPYEFASYVSEDFEEFTENPLELDIYDDTVLIVNYTEINIGLFSLTSEFYQELEEKYNSNYFSPEDALAIKTAEDFFDFAKFSNNGNNFEKRYVILSEDIDLESRSWTSIKQFSGVFDGNGKKIENLSIEGANNGIFSTNNGTVKSFLVASGTIDSTASIIGTIAANNKGLILNCGNKADIIKGQTAGGISGKLTGSIAYCFNSGNIINGNSLGGIIGATVKGSVVYSCYNTGEISGQVAGGIAGMATTNFKVSNSFNMGQVTGTMAEGGLLGYCMFAIQSDNNFYLESTAENAIGMNPANYNVNVEAVSNEDIKNLDSRLGEAFKSGASVDYPVLIWEDGGDYLAEEWTTLAVDEVSAENGKISLTLNKTLNYHRLEKNDFALEIKKENEPDYHIQSITTIEIKESGGKTVVTLNFDKFEESKVTEKIQIRAGFSEQDKLETSFTLSTSQEWIEYAAESLKGEGSKEYPFEISTPEELVYIAQSVKEGETFRDNYFILTTDIDLGEKKWTSIGIYNKAGDSGNREFAGIFDGNHNKIESLWIPSTDNNTARADYLGLFAYNTGEIKNLTVTGTASGYNVAGIVARNEGIIKNAVSKVNITNIKKSGNYFVGGICASTNNSIYAAVNLGEIHAVNSEYATGGIVGAVTDDAVEDVEIIDCDNYGYINGRSNAAGIVGYIRSRENVLIKNCSNSANIETYRGSIAGIIATYLSGYCWLEVENCYNTGDLYSEMPTTTTAGMGGIVGNNTRGASFKNNYNAGMLYGDFSITGAFFQKASGEEIEGINNYYLNNSFPIIFHGDTTYFEATPLTRDEMTAKGFLDLINGENSTFISDPSRNNGYPIFERQNKILELTELRGVPSSAENSEDGKIIGLDSAKKYEYRRISAYTQLAYETIADSDSIDNLSSGNYYIRLIDEENAKPVIINVPNMLVGDAFAGNGETSSAQRYNINFVVNLWNHPKNAALKYTFYRADNAKKENSEKIKESDLRYYIFAPEDVGKYIYAEVTAEGYLGKHEVAFGIVGKISQPDAPQGLEGIAPSASGTDGKIVGLDSAILYEYRLSAEEEFIEVPLGLTEITGLISGHYNVRLKETQIQETSKIATLTIPDTVLPSIYGKAAVNKNSNELAVTVVNFPSDADLKYQWIKTDVSGTNTELIAGANGNKYILKDSDNEKLVFVEISADNYAGNLIAGLEKEANVVLGQIVLAAENNAYLKITDENNVSYNVFSYKDEKNQEIHTSAFPIGKYKYDVILPENSKSIGSGYLDFKETAHSFFLREVDFNNQLTAVTDDYTMTMFDDEGNEYFAGSQEVSDGKYKARFVLPADLKGKHYTYAFQVPEGYWGSYGDFYNYQVNFTENFRDMNLSDSGKFVISKSGVAKIIVPKDAEFSLNKRVKFYRPLEVLKPKEVLNLGEMVQYIYDVPSGGLHYEIKLDGYVKKARLVTFKAGETNSLEITKSDLIQEDKQDIDDNDYIANLMMNVPDSKYIKLSDGEDFELYFHRNWQAINSITGNYYVDPDYNVEVIFGDSVEVISPYFAGATVKAVEGKSGISIVRVIYDALDYVSTGDKGYVYSKLWEENTALIVFNVNPKGNSKIHTNINHAEVETKYYIRSINNISQSESKMYYEYTFKPTVEGSTIERVSVHNPVKSTEVFPNDWEAVTANSDNSYTVELTDGRNLIRITAADGSEEYHSIRAYGLDIKISGDQIDTQLEDGKFIINAQIGETINISYEGIEMPLPKLGAIYNPGFPDKTYLVYDLVSVNGNEKVSIESDHTQYGIRTVNTIRLDVSSPDTYLLMNGKIHSTSIGENGSTHRRMTKGGLVDSQSNYVEGGNSGETINGLFCNLPDFEINIKGSEDKGDFYSVQIKAPENTEWIGVRNSLDYLKSGVQNENVSTYSLANNGSKEKYTVYLERKGYETIVKSFTVEDKDLVIDLQAEIWKKINQSGTVTVDIKGYEAIFANRKGVEINSTYKGLREEGHALSNSGGYTALHALIESLEIDFSCKKGVLSPQQIISGKVGANAFWICEVNDKVVEDYANYHINNNDKIVFYYNKDTSINMRHAWFTESEKTVGRDQSVSIKLMSAKVKNTGGTPTPVAGADIFIDGRKVGQTNENGALTIHNLGSLTLGAHVITAELNNSLTYARLILNIEKGSESSGGGTLPENKIKVSFRLIGDTEHKPAFNGYINWIKTKDYYVDTDSTMEDLFKEALSANGMQHDSTADNYVSWICAPSILGSYKLEEFTNGPNSGWMYTVNGVHPSVGLCEYVLQNNDEVIWHYVNDYTLETSFEGSIAPYLNSWLKALDIEPHEGMIGESKENANKSSIGSSDDESSSNTANSCVVTTKAEEENGKAIATIEENAITNAIKDVNRNERDGITIRLETSHNITSVTALIERTSVKSIYDETDVGIMLETNLGNFAIPHDTLKTILDSLENQTIYLTIEKLNLSPYAPEILNRISNSEGYKVSISDGTDNITDLGKNEVTIALPYELKSNELPEDVFIWEINENGDLTEIGNVRYDKDSNLFIFDTYTLSKYVIGFITITEEVTPLGTIVIFSDVPKDHWAYQYIMFIAEKKIMSGFGDGTFAPERDITRAEFVTLLFNLSGDKYIGKTDRFSDVSVSAWYSEYVAWALEKGITSGTTETTFSPNANISRQDMALMIVRYLGLIGEELPVIKEKNLFADNTQIADYAKEAVEVMQRADIINGRGENIFAPRDSATRAETAKMIADIVRQIEE